MYSNAPHRIPIETFDWYTGHHWHPVCQLPVPNIPQHTNILKYIQHSPGFYNHEFYPALSKNLDPECYTVGLTFSAQV
jgi:hypothetical protein